MRYESEIDSSVSTALPELALTDRMVASMRAFLQSRGLDDYQIFDCADMDVDDIDPHLNLLDEQAQQ